MPIESFFCSARLRELHQTHMCVCAGALASAPLACANCITRIVRYCCEKLKLLLRSLARIASQIICTSGQVRTFCSARLRELHLLCAAILHTRPIFCSARLRELHHWHYYSDCGGRCLLLRSLARIASRRDPRRHQGRRFCSARLRELHRQKHTMLFSRMKQCGDAIRKLAVTLHIRKHDCRLCVQRIAMK